jgi:hypothetical protein
MSKSARDVAKTLAVDFPQKQLHELQIYSLKATASDITYAADSVLAFEFPHNCVIHSFGYKCITAWDADPIVQIGTSTSADKFCTLTIAELGEDGKSGVKMVQEEIVASDFDATGFNVTLTFDQNSAGAGAMDLWLYYRPGLAQSAALR